MEIVGLGFLLAIVLGIASLVMVVYALVDLFRRPMETTMRVLWLVVILCFPIIGSVAYLIVNRTARGPAV